MLKRNILNSPRLAQFKKGRRRVFLNKLFLSLFALLVIFTGLAYFSRVSGLNIKAVEIIGNKVTDAETIKTAVEKEIAGNYLWFFSKTNILYYPKNNIEKELHRQFDRLKDVNFTIKDRKILEVSVTERTALYTWCGNVLPETDINPKCYFMDEAGFIFDEAPYFSGEVYFKFFGPADTGTYFLKENFKQLVDFKDALTAMGLKPASLYIKNDGDIEIYLSSNILPPNSPKIIFKKDFDIEKLSENLQAALDAEPLLSNLKKKYSSLLYIDLRFGNKVYYKFR